MINCHEHSLSLFLSGITSNHVNLHVHINTLSEVVSKVLAHAFGFAKDVNVAFWKIVVNVLLYSGTVSVPSFNLDWDASKAKVGAILNNGIVHPVPNGQDLCKLVWQSSTQSNQLDTKESSNDRS